MPEIPEWYKPHKKAAQCFCCDFWRERILEILDELIAEEFHKKQIAEEMKKDLLR